MQEANELSDPAEQDFIAAPLEVRFLERLVNVCVLII
jgi:hypothetical protein